MASGFFFLRGNLKMNAKVKDEIRDEIRKRLTGRLPICNGVCSRAPQIPFTNRFFLCWRCIGIYTGFFLYLLVAPELVISSLPVALITFCLGLLTFIDGGIQYIIFKIESTNKRRFSSGLISGISIAIIITNFSFSFHL